jgi:epoxyqueuosine reductase
LLSLTQAVKDEARRLGFDLAGVTTPDPPPHFPTFQHWLNESRHGEMRYLETERALTRRSDPRQILPECRSILVLGIRYFAPGSVSEAPVDPSAQGKTGRVASYAWGSDYHDVLPQRLKALVSFIEDQVGDSFPNRWYTDTGPILERDIAQRAGLGWIGKNTCLIHPGKGSYYLLSEILLGIELEPDPPFETDHCGSCTRCLDACPTSCILPDRTIDARRCISYLTIELKEAIPLELRPQIGDWVFGCDICQQVCPWNERFARPEGDPAFAPRPGLPAPDLEHELENLTPEAFAAKFKGSPVKRAKRRGYLRNVAVALGNMGRPESVSILAKVLLTEAESLVRGQAAWALGRLGGEEAAQALHRARQRETDPEVLAEITGALSGYAAKPE